MMHATKIRTDVRGFFVFFVVFCGLFLTTRIILLAQVRTLTCNHGISFGVEIPTVVFTFLWIAIVTFLIIAWRAVYHKNIFTQLPYILILAGALSNISDRFFYGCVIDYIQIVPWNIFNLADVSISIGAIMIIYKNITQKNDSRYQH